MEDPINESVPFPERTDFSEFNQAIQLVKSNIGAYLMGQQQLVELMLTAVFAQGHILLEGVPGVAKTLAAKLLAKTLDIPFARIQFTPDLMPADVLGTAVFNPQTSNFEFKPGPIFAQVVLIDEINRAPAKTQAALFEVMEENQVTRDGHTYSMKRPFLVIATQNPVEQEGTYRLPEAQLDRFLFKIKVDYPSAAEEVQMLNTYQQRNGQLDIQAVHSVLGQAQIEHFQQLIGQIQVAPALLEYIVTLVQTTRQSKDIYLGASPRASLHLLNAAKSYAAMQGRDFVIPDDIRFVAIPVMRHRIMLTPDREMEGIPPEQIIQGMIDRVEVPR